MDEATRSRMRADWNARAREDAHYYVAFGRRGQEDEEFFSTAAEVVKGIEWEMRRLRPAASTRAWRALEIGCGPGRLMRPMSRHFGEIHGVDVSDEMIRLARERLRGIPHAHVQATSGADLAQFADESFDFVYSYAVFQHIPDRNIVLNYLREARRVMKPEAVFRFQASGLPETARASDTWSGARISAMDMETFLRENDFQVLALEGAATQYMWLTARKRPRGWHELPGVAAAPATIRRITNAHSSEPVAPAAGRFAAVSLWIENLPDECDIGRLECFIGGARGTVYYIGPPEKDGLQQVNARLPWSAETGLAVVELRWHGNLLAAPRTLRIIPPPPLVPRVVALSDGINLVSGNRIETRTVKVTLEEVTDPGDLDARVDGLPATDVDIFCTDPIPPRHEVNFRLPDQIAAGGHQLELRLGRRLLGPMPLEVA